MYFAEFAQLLFEHTAHRMTQPEFTEGLLTSASDQIPVDISTSSYKRFFSGKTEGSGNAKRVVGDNLGAFACKYLTDVNAGSLSEYMLELIGKADAANQVCAAFKKELPMLSSDNLEKMAEDLAALFSKIIGEVITAYQNCKSNMSTGLHAGFASEVDELLDLLLNIAKRFEKLVADFQRYELEYLTAGTEKQQRYRVALAKDYDDFIALNDMLIKFTHRHPDFKALIDLFFLGDSMPSQAFLLGDAERRFNLPEGTLEYFRTLLRKVMKTAPDYLGQSSAP